MTKTLFTGHGADSLTWDADPPDRSSGRSEVTSHPSVVFVSRLLPSVICGLHEAAAG